jgi:hypothetical protein
MRGLPNGTTEYLSCTIAPDTTAAEMAEFFADDAEVRGRGCRGRGGGGAGDGACAGRGPACCP